MNMNRKHQSGIALIVGLIVLLLLTLITLVAIRVSTLEEKMSSNARDHNIAFQAAESALREAEALLRTPAPPFHPLKLSDPPFRNMAEPRCVTGYCSNSGPSQSELFPNVEGKRTAATGISNINAEPEYIIELVRVDPSVDSSRLNATFRITARAWGGDNNSVVQLESTYRLHALSFAY